MTKEEAIKAAEEYSKATIALGEALWRFRELLEVTDPDAPLDSAMQKVGAVAVVFAYKITIMSKEDFMANIVKNNAKGSEVAIKEEELKEALKHN